MPAKPTYEELEAKVRALEKEIACRRESERILALNDHNYKTLVENTPDIFYRTDMDGKVIYASPAVYQQSGYTVNDVIGMDMAQDVYVHPHERSLFIEKIRKYGYVRNFEAELRRKDGTTWWACTNAQFFRDKKGRIQGVEGITRDITSIKKAEKEQARIRRELEASHKMLDSLLNAVPDLLVVIDRRFTIRYSNFKGCQDQTKGRIRQPQTCYSCFKKRKIPCPNCTAMPVFYSGQITERQIFDPEDGRTREVRVFPIFDAQGQVEMVVEHIRDITGEKMMEAERQNYEARIQQMQKMEAIGTLAGGIAHDFNNILVAVIGYTELVLAGTPQGDSQYRNLQQILGAGMRARDLVHQILTFSRQDKRELKPLQIGSLVKETLKMLRSTLPTTIEIKHELSANVDNVMADPTQIHQIVMNLCTNAAQAMDDGGILSVWLSQVELPSSVVIKHPGSRPGSYALLSVQDTGKGIAPHVFDKIFNPYFTTKEKGKGTGLGLSVVHGIVQSYGGFITVNSKQGQGTIFKVYVPTCDPGPLNDEPLISDLPMGSERILVVDDEPIVAEVVQEMLSLLGYQVTSADNGLGALEIFQGAPYAFDLVLTDMTMPKMTGDRLSMEIKNIRPDIPIILFTGYSDKLEGKNADDFGLQDIVIKPIQQADLAKTVRSVLDRVQEPSVL